ncbi:Mor transcription activator family protein [Malaciobacter marinus]|uniref:Mor transcription activator family protein n=1 Tax=Malaciobacter marinus TaxID=505249 RepID=UPI003B008106
MSAITNLDLFEDLFNYIKQSDVDLTSVIKEYGGTSYYIPSYKTTLRNKEIIKEYKEKLGEVGLVKRLAKENHLTERQIYDITRSVREASSLF